MSIVTSPDGTRIRYDKIGAGPGDVPPVIVVDGALCHRAFGPAAPVAKRLAPHFTVITYDRRGRGDSGDTTPYAVEREIDDLEALIHAVGGEAYLIGFSSGGVLALDAAARLDGIKKVAVYEAPFIVDDTHPPRPDDVVPRMERLLAENRRADVVRMFMKIVGVPSFVIFTMRFLPFWPKLKAVAHTLPYDFTILGDTGSGKPLPADRWSAVTVPALVMDGGKSPAWLRNAGRELASVVPHGEHRTLEGQTHQVKPEVIAPVLREFFAADSRKSKSS